MRLILTFLLASLHFVTFAQNDVFFNKADNFFQSFVEEGRVNYSAIKNNPAQLNELMNHIASNSWTEKEEKAYLINVYNLGVISKVVKHYPLESTEEISNFFDAMDLALNGDEISLNHIENQLLRPKYQDPRLHFVLVCGAIGCPSLRAGAYRIETLEDQLEKQTSIAVNDQFFVYQDSRQNKTFLSEIFIWYKDDFGGKNDSILAFISKYKDDPFDVAKPIQTYTYNWSLNDLKKPDLKTPMNKPPKDSFNLQTFTAGCLLGKNKFDLTLFNTLYTENKSNWKGQDFTGFRATFVTHLFQLTYGISKSKRVNIGLDFNLKNNGRTSDSTTSGIGTAFQYTNTDTTRFALTSIGARVKIQPFKAVGNFSIQSTFIVPIIKNPEGIFIAPGDPGNRYWGDWDRFTWWNQFFFDHTWPKFQLFTEIDLWFRFKKNPGQYTALDIPMSVIFSYFPTTKMTFYAITQHVPRFTYNISQPAIDTDWIIPMNYTASGIGFKYNLTPALNLELLYTNFWRGRNTGLGQTFNIGIKYITK
jgi:Protein of unknown function, DUF547